MHPNSFSSHGFAASDGPGSAACVHGKRQVSTGYGRGSKKLGVPTANLPESQFAENLRSLPTGEAEGKSCKNCPVRVVSRSLLSRVHKAQTGACPFIVIDCGRLFSTGRASLFSLLRPAWCAAPGESGSILP